MKTQTTCRHCYFLTWPLSKVKRTKWETFRTSTLYSNILALNEFIYTYSFFRLRLLLELLSTGKAVSDIRLQLWRRQMHDTCSRSCQMAGFCICDGETFSSAVTVLVTSKCCILTVYKYKYSAHATSVNVIQEADGMLLFTHAKKRLKVWFVIKQWWCWWWGRGRTRNWLL